MIRLSETSIGAVCRAALWVALLAAGGACSKTARILPADGATMASSSRPDAAAGAVTHSPRPPLRSPSVVRSQGNHLIGERSLYLRQHARNPIDWYPWGAEAITWARAENKPIFVSIGYSSCHWCHVMEKEVFEKDDIAAYMNAHFISIKVDREERPDLDAVYMEAVQRMTGSGGWPMSVFLTPELKPFHGATFIPYDSFLPLVRRLHDAFSNDRAGVDASAHRLADVVAEAGPPPASGTLTDAVLEEISRGAAARYDARWGGFLSRVKFPTPVRWSFLLHRYRKTGLPALARMVRGTLDAMVSGGIYDHVGGGFHRYATERAWLVPHFEKILYDQAQLASLYVEASAVFAEPRYAEVARDTLDFLLREMLDSNGGFFASFDADSGGREGTFYLWTPAELARVAGVTDGPALALLLGATNAGNFERSNILTRRVEPSVVAAKMRRPTRDVDALLPRWRPSLRAFRAKRPAPALDRKIVTSWNGLAIAALAKAARGLGEERYRVAAERTAEYLARASP